MEEEKNVEQMPPKNKSRGVWVEMADGKEWKVPFMPVGPKAVPLLDMLSELEEMNKTLDDVIETTAEEGGDNDAQMQAIREKANPGQMSVKNFEFGYAVLKLNYPNLEREECEGLFDLISFSELVNVFTGIKRIET